jgi:hypothetical protein
MRLLLAFFAPLLCSILSTRSFATPTSHSPLYRITPLPTPSLPPTSLEAETLITMVENNARTVQHLTGVRLPDTTALRTFCGATSTSLVQCQKRAVDTNRYLLRLHDQILRHRYKEKKLALDYERVRQKKASASRDNSSTKKLSSRKKRS